MLKHKNILTINPMMVHPEVRKLEKLQQRFANPGLVKNYWKSIFWFLCLCFEKFQKYFQK